jgi:hypothetical protein
LDAAQLAPITCIGAAQDWSSEGSSRPRLPAAMPTMVPSVVAAAASATSAARSVPAAWTVATMTTITARSDAGATTGASAAWAGRRVAEPLPQRTPIGSLAVGGIAAPLPDGAIEISLTSWLVLRLLRCLYGRGILTVAPVSGAHAAALGMNSADANHQNYRTNH